MVSSYCPPSTSSQIHQNYWTQVEASISCLVDLHLSASYTCLSLASIPIMTIWLWRMWEHLFHKLAMYLKDAKWAGWQSPIPGHAEAVLRKVDTTEVAMALEKKPNQSHFRSACPGFCWQRFPFLCLLGELLSRWGSKTHQEDGNRLTSTGWSAPRLG